MSYLTSLRNEHSFLHMAASHVRFMVFVTRINIPTFRYWNQMRLLSLAICVVAVFGAKNPECPNEIASEECEDDCVRANTECILECDDGNCVRVVLKRTFQLHSLEGAIELANF